MDTSSSTTDASDDVTDEQGFVSEAPASVDTAPATELNVTKDDDRTTPSNNNAGVTANEGDTSPQFAPADSDVSNPVPDAQPGTLRSRSWLYDLEQDIDYRIDRYRRDGKDPLDLFDPSKPDYLGKSVVIPLARGYGSPLASAPQFAQNSPPIPTPQSAASTLYGPPLPVILPNGQPVLDPNTGQPLMSPTTDLRPVAEEGRKTGEIFRELLKTQEAPSAAYEYLAMRLFFNLAQGGHFDYQRIGAGPVFGRILGFTYIGDFQPVANFNVGLFCQQAGLTLDETLRVAGSAALLKSSNADPTTPYGLADKNRRLITHGYDTGASGVFGSTISP